jgi:3-hydroxyisobutyrate dehydrogenase
LVTTVGVIGIGRMGLPVCANLVLAGHGVLVYDLRPELAEVARDKGAVWVADVRELASQVDVLLTVLPGPGELRDAMTLAAPGLRSGCAWIDLTTATPATVADFRDELGVRGVDCLEATMGSGAGEETAGSLLLFVGGSALAVERHRALLEVLGTINHVGQAGAGYVVKLIVNLLWFGQAVASAEAMLLARRAGLDLEVLRDTLVASAASSRFISRDLDAVLDGDYLAGFGLDRCCEELDEIAEIADGLGVPFELSSQVRETYARALERFGAVDGQLLPVAMLEQESGIDLRRGSAHRLT